MIRYGKHLQSARVPIFRRADNAENTTEAGRVLEDLVCYLFKTVPGITVSKRNELNEFHSEEIDVAFWEYPNRSRSVLFYRAELGAKMAR